MDSDININDDIDEKQDIANNEEKQEEVIDYNGSVPGIPPAKFCPICKSLVRREATLCSRCGYQFNQEN